MRTRRRLLQDALLTTLVTCVAEARPSNRFEISREATCLSRESARGFELVPAPVRDCVVVCAAGEKAIAMAADLQRRAMHGAWIFWENAPHDPAQQRQFEAAKESLRSVFGIEIGQPFDPGLYVEYLWPEPALTRSFLCSTPVVCDVSEIVAWHCGRPVVMRRRMGRGGIVFFGSMLGPHLYAGDPQAHAIANCLLNALAV